MTGILLGTIFIPACLALLAAAAGALLAWLAFIRPRLGLYATLALTPAQFIFVPVFDFFLSPADVIVFACAGGLVARLAAGNRSTWIAVRLHVMLGLMFVAYLIGFLVLGHFSRTLVRVPLAIVPSILACELLADRKHFRWAIVSLIVAGVLDAGYGMYFLAAGQSLHPTRFSGLMGVNFSAIVILTAAATAFACLARTREPVKLLPPAILALFGLATLSKMGVLAFVLACGIVLWRVATPKNRRLVLAGAVILVAVTLAEGSLRERVLARTMRAELLLDGVARTSTDVRVLILRAAWHAFSEQPFVGVGYFNFQPYSIREPEIRASTAGLGYVTHNTYLEILVEGGLLAFVPFFLHFLSYVNGLRPAWTAVAQRHDGVVGAVLAAVLIMVVSASVTNLLLHYLFWSVCGVALACFERLKGEDSSLARAS